MESRGGMLCFMGKKNKVTFFFVLFDKYDIYVLIQTIYRINKQIFFNYLLI